MPITSPETLHKVDEWLLLVLRMQPSEIDGLDMDDYWRWFEAAQAHNKRLQGD